MTKRVSKPEIPYIKLYLNVVSHDLMRIKILGKLKFRFDLHQFAAICTNLYHFDVLFMLT